MILEGFEIENWSCIKRIAVDGLQPTGVIVMHGPNGTGKTSIIAALRACLMDFPSNSTAKDLKRWFPKNSSEKPRVCVTFRVQGTSWRITKRFGSKESKLESRSTAGTWKLEKSTSTDAHEQLRSLLGNKNSDAGLHQLLWLTQAEFHLPDPKKFDPDVKSQLRAVLGVLQTPLDDRFLSCVQDEWSRWFSGRSKPGEKPKLKKDCPLDKKLAVLKELKTELAEIEAEYQRFEGMMEKSGNLEILSRDLRRQLQDKSRSCDLLQEEYQKSLTRLQAHQLAQKSLSEAEKNLKDQHALQQRRADSEQRILLTEKAVEAAGRDAEEKSRRLEAAELRLRELRREFLTLENTRRESQGRLNQVIERRELITLNEKVKTAQESLKRAEQTAAELEELKKQERVRPAPPVAILKMLEENRTKAARLRADLEAAAITLALTPQPGATVPPLLIDGTPTREAKLATDGAPIRHSIRRRAEITIPGWGHAELTRGFDARDLDQIETELNELDRKFAESLAPFGVAAGDPTALDQLRGLAAEKRVREPELKRKQDELDRDAPHGLDSLRQATAQLERIQQASQSEPASQPGLPQLPSDVTELERLTEQLKKDITANETSIAGLEQVREGIEHEIDGNPEPESTTGRRNVKANQNKTASPGLRRQQAEATERHTTLKATAEAYRLDLERLQTSEQIKQAIENAEKAVVEARNGLELAKLSESEETVRERLEAANEGLRALQGQLSAAQKEFHQIEGALRLSEGLHPRRAAAAVRVEELTRQIDRETLESEAFDRLYALFEECREKQLGAVMGPIHDRVLRWMRLLRIGSYQSIRFNDHFLPETLLASDGATEFLIGEESIGTIEQIALMVRLALGSTLSSPEEPVVAMLDDPLTHSDVVRLDRMRAVLKNASGGDTASTLTAGPLQVVLFTCHPEWFAVDGAQVIDLSKLDVSSRA